MEVLNDNGNGKEETPQQESPKKKTHEEYLQQFAGRLNEILQEGYPLPAVIQVLDSALFEMKISLYFQQVEMAERQKKQQIQIPRMTIPTGKIK
jgi:hypothetical protein